MSQTKTNENMGTVITTLTVTNRLDQGNAKNGLIPLEQVRSVTLDNVVADRGVKTLCLSPNIIAKLGLKLLRETRVEINGNVSKARIFQDTSISLLGREGTFDCLEVTNLKYPLLGAIPMDMLGIEIDLKNQRLILLPDNTEDTYLLM